MGEHWASIHPGSNPRQWLLTIGLRTISINLFSGQPKNKAAGVSSGRSGHPGALVSLDLIAILMKDQPPFATWPILPEANYQAMVDSHFVTPLR
ncbi:MAG: hypothetical protein H6561_13560 [Lewinellaceae bacterium]|nr:hypothetical protein [Lewinellaceae bacterium]